MDWTNKEAWLGKAQASELEAICAIETRCYALPWSLQFFKDCLLPGYCFKVIRIEAVVVGYMILFESDHQIFDLMNIAIDLPHQNQGLGQWALKTWLSEQENKVSEVWLEVRKTNFLAQRVYENIGFKPIRMRRGYYEDGEDAIVYCLNVNPLKDRH